MTQDKFLEEMIDTGYVSVKASELRTLLQNYNNCKNNNKKQNTLIKELNEVINYWKNKYDVIATKENIRIDLEV